MASSRCALVSGAGDPAGSRLTTSSGSSRSPVPVPTRSGCRTPGGAWRSSPATWPGRGSSSRRRSWGRILARNGISLQRTRSWKQSPDPDYAAKAARVLALYREQPTNGVVVSFDEKGPESLCPKHGRGWARRGRPERQRATYTRRQGIRYLVGALDVHADYLRIRPRPRRNGASTLAFMKQIRLAYPKQIRLYWIQDGLSSHWTPEIRGWAAENNMELVPTPTYASYLNRIESTFGAIDEFVC